MFLIYTLVNHISITTAAGDIYYITYAVIILVMRHRYIHFPPNGPLDDRNRPIGICECGTWKDDSTSVPCPNAVATNQGKLYFSPS